jgi:5-hydroxyisourate hydrolase-like protein (transthyretin family)
MATRSRTLAVVLILLLLLAVGGVVLWSSSPERGDAGSAATASDASAGRAKPGAGGTARGDPKRRAGAGDAETEPTDGATAGSGDGELGDAPPSPRDQGAGGGDPSSPGSPSSPPPPSSPSAASAPEKLAGHVLDAGTNEPLEGVRVLYTVLVDDKVQTWQGATTRADGLFDNKRPEGWDRKGARLELRVAKDGYETSYVPVPDASPVVRLRRRDHPLLPGRVLGVARDAASAPLTGVLLVDGSDEMDGNASQYAVADAAGAFVLEGVPPGPWRFSLSGGQRVEATVVEGGETRIELRVPKDLRTDEDRVQGRIDAGWGKPPAVPLVDGRRPAPREVVVTGLPQTPGTVVRAHWTALAPRLFWRFEAKAGEARFPALPVGNWTLTILEPGKPSPKVPCDVPAGEGQLRIPADRQ